MLLTIVSESRLSSKLVLRETEALESDRVGEASLEVCLHVVHINFIVRALGARECGLDAGKIKFHDVTRVVRVGCRAVIGAEQALSLEVLSDHLDTMGVSADQIEVLNGLVIDWEEAHGRTVLRRHVGNRSPVSKGKVGATITEELNELANDTTFAEHVSACKNQISGSGVRRKLASEFKADNLGQNHGNLLAKHDRLSLDTSDTPADNTEAIDHSGVRISADARVRVEHAILFEDDTCEPLKIHLMDDTVARWHNAEVAEGSLAPLEEGEALLVPVELDLLIAIFRVLSPGDIDLNRVVNNEVSLAEWVDLFRITTKLLHGSSHSGEVNDGRDTSEILEEDTGWLERNLNILLG